MDVLAVDATVSMIEAALVTIVRETSLPSLQERVTARAGVPVERAGYGVLRVLDESEPMPISALARLLGLDTSTVSRQVSVLVRDGLITRAQGADDRRVILVSLSGAGRDALVRLRAARHEVFAAIVSGWSDDDRAALAPLLGRLAADFVASGGRG